MNNGRDVKSANAIKVFYDLWKDPTYDSRTLSQIVNTVSSRLTDEDSNLESNWQNYVRNGLQLNSRNSNGPWLQPYEVNVVASQCSERGKQVLAEVLNETY